MGLKLRGSNDDSPPMITGNSSVVTNVKPESNNTNIIDKLWTMVIGKVTRAIDKLVDESVAINEDQNQDRDSPKSDRIVNTEKTENRADTEPNRQTKTSKSRTTLDSEKPAIKVGDRVTVEDAPSYWSWASPFTVMAINGEMAKLEMVDELVEVSRLSLIV